MKAKIKIMFPGGRVENEEIDVEDSAGGRYCAIKALYLKHLPDAQTEHVAVLYKDARRDMFVDEDGHSKGLARNDAATDIYRHNTMVQQPTLNPEVLPHVVGVAVLFTDFDIWK